MEAAGWIREHFGQEDDLRIVALTGDALKETRRAALRSGMDDFLSKPVQIEDLERVLKGSGVGGEDEPP